MQRVATAVDQSFSEAILSKKVPYGTVRTGHRFAAQPSLIFLLLSWVGVDSRCVLLLWRVRRKRRGGTAFSTSCTMSTVGRCSLAPHCPLCCEQRSDEMLVCAACVLVRFVCAVASEEDARDREMYRMQSIGNFSAQLLCCSAVLFCSRSLPRGLLLMLQFPWIAR